MFRNKCETLLSRPRILNKISKSNKIKKKKSNLFEKCDAHSLFAISDVNNIIVDCIPPPDQPNRNRFFI